MRGTPPSSPSIGAITPVYERTNMAWLQEQRDSLVNAGVTTLYYAGPKHVLAEVMCLPKVKAGEVFYETYSRNVAWKRNELLNLVTEPWLVVADCDDVWTKGGLTSLLPAGDGVGAVLGNAVDMNEVGEVLPSPPTPPGLYDFDGLWKYWQTTLTGNPHGNLPFHMNSGIWSTEVVRRAGGWRQDFNNGRYGEDIALAFAVAALQPIRVTSLLIFFYRKHEGSLITRATEEQETVFHHEMKELYQRVHNQ